MSNKLQKQKLFLLAFACCSAILADDQTRLGAGDATAIEIGLSSPLVRSALRAIVRNVRQIRDWKLREVTLDAVSNPETCVAHRVGVSEKEKKAVLTKLREEGLLEGGEEAEAGVFPPLKNDGGACPQIPLPLIAAPGSGFGGHHSYPGGLAVHEAFNLESAKNFAALYRKQYGKNISIDRDLVLAAPAWHDWAKTMVFQWTAEGTEFSELSFGGTGRGDNNGSAGDSRTGAHHILGLAEAMARGLSPEFLVTQASAHAAPTLGNEFKVVNWLRTAAVVARVDPAAKGYLVMDGGGHWRLPPLRQLKNGIDLNKEGQTNFLLEYQIHNLSDTDFVESMPAAALADLLLRSVAKRFGYDAADTVAYNNQFRNIVLANIGPERLTALYSRSGLDGVAGGIGKMKAARNSKKY